MILYFLPMFVVIAVLTARYARRDPSAPKATPQQIMLGLVAVVVLGAVGIGLAWAMGRNP